ncbi:hypothetical protein [Arthrobacter sp. H5]|uniref:hypothetical protein n=1 Tax=Arthrobacter sp. H5 TaxID=1267973 RepID=UPI0004B7A77A|nr:hypothetical protein [Arthrobacter sp. H5]
MAADQLFTIIGIALLWALIIGVATFMLLKALRRFSLVLQFCVVLLGTVAVMVAGMISAVNAMVVTARDLEIMW